MNSIIKQLKKFSVAIIGVVLIGGGYYFFIIRGGSEAISLDAGLDPVRSIEVARIVALLQDLKSIDIDESIFSHPTLTRLEDFELEISEEAQSRDNPFAPIGQ